MKSSFVFACVLAFVLAPFGAEWTLAQGRSTGAPARAGRTDTLVLSLARARRLALEKNPAFLADAQEREIARGELEQARVYRYNPDVEFEAPGAASLGGIGGYEARLGQEIEWAGQWGLRQDAAERGLERASSSVRNAARLTLAESSRAFYRVLAAERRLGVAEEVLALNERLRDAVRTQLRLGEISALDANLAEIEYGRAKARVLAARRERSSAVLELKRMLGLSSDRPIRLVEAVPETPDPATLDREALLTRALEQRPDLAARRAAVEEWETRADLAGREAIPNLNIGAYAERENATGEPRIGIGVGLPLPVWNRNQGVIAQRRARTRQATLDRRATELRIREQVEDAYRSYVAASEEARVYETDVLEPARENQRGLERAYQAGKIDLPELLLLRNQLLDAELGYWNAWLAKHEALVRLRAATAELGSGEDDG